MVTGRLDTHARAARLRLRGRAAVLKRTAIAALIASVWSTAAHAQTELKIVTGDGYVAFAAGDDWPVVARSTDLPVIAAVFQLPNPADAGTPHSTNLAIRFFDLSVEEARLEFENADNALSATPPIRETIDDWSITRQRASQGVTEYSVVDAKRKLTSLSVAVRLAWPHLPDNPSTYTDDMERTLRAILSSIRQHVGPWQPDEEETIRRRTP